MRSSIVVLLVVAGASARGETIDFQDGVFPTAAYRGTRDTIIKEGGAVPSVSTLNFGTVPRLRVTTVDIGTNARTVTLVRWDLSAWIPPGAVVTGVSLTLDVEASETGATTSIYDLRKMWVEGDGSVGSGATWLTYDGVTPWASAGAQDTTGGDADRGDTVLGTIPGAPAGPKTVNLNATGIGVVQGWVDDPSANYGLIVRLGGGDATDYGSRETGTPARRPRLTVTFTPPSSGGTPTTVTFRQGQNGYTGATDSYIRSDDPNDNFGGSGGVQIDSSGGNTRRGLFRWDTSSIPATATVTAASLVLDSGGNGTTHTIYPLLKSWTENGVTWNSTGTGPWSSSGADATGGSNPDQGTTPLAITTGGGGVRTTDLNPAGVAVVQGWVSNPANNFGLIIRSPSSSNATTTYDSSENGTVATRPGLVVTYVPPGSGTLKTRTVTGTESWTDPDWSPPGLPGPDDSVLLLGDGTLQLGTTATVARLVATGPTLDITGGTFTVTGLTWVSGGGPPMLQNDLVVRSGATFVGQGLVRVLHTSRLRILGGTVRLGSATCWVGGALVASGAGSGLIQDALGVPMDVQVRGTLDADQLLVRGGDLEGLHVYRTGSVTRLRRCRFEGLPALAQARYLTIEQDGPFHLSAPGCSFDAVAAGRHNVRLVDTHPATPEDVVLNLEQRGAAVSGAGAGAAFESELPATADGPSINWVHAAPDGTRGTAVGFPQVAWDLDTFIEYATYAQLRDVDGPGTTDRIHVFDPFGDGVDQGYWFDVPQSAGDIVGYPWWDELNGSRVLWVATTTGRLFRFTNPGAGSGAIPPDAGFPRTTLDGGQAVAFTTPPLTAEPTTVFVGGLTAGAPRLYAFDAATGTLAWRISTNLPDPITSELSSETIQGVTKLFLGGGAAVPGGGVTLLQTSFSGSASPFVYQDDAFRGTSNPSAASGAYGGSFGQSGGGVRVTVGPNSVNMSGGYRATFNVPGTAPVAVRIDFSYRQVQSSEFEFDEYGETLVSVDGVLYGTGTNDWVFRLVGDGNGGPTMDSGWRSFTIVTLLGPGPHTLILGGFLNKATFTDETVRFSFDNVLVQTNPADGRIYRIDTSTRLVDLQDTTPFAPVVAAPFPAYRTGLFVGDQTGRMHGLEHTNSMTPLPGWPIQGGSSQVLGSAWLDFVDGRVFWGDEAGTVFAYTVGGAPLPNWPRSAPLGNAAGVRNVRSDGGVLWVGSQGGRVQQLAIASGAATGPLYRFGADHPVGPISSHFVADRSAILCGGKYLVLFGAAP